MGGIGTLMAQKALVDSLKLSLINAKHDTTRFNIRFMIGELTPIHRMGYWDSLKNDCETALKVFDGKSNSKMSPEQKVFYTLEAGAIGNMAFIAQRTGDVAQSLILQERSLRMRELIGDKLGQANSLHNIIQIYKGQGQWPMALEYSKKVLKIGEETKNKFILGVAYNGIGHIYLKTEITDSAMKYFDQSLTVRKEINDISGIADCYYCMGLLYQKRGDINQALKNFNETVHIYEKMGDEGSKAATLCHVGKMHLQLKNYSMAFKCLNESSDISNKLGYPELIRNSSSMLAKTYKATGNYKLALQNYEIYIRFRDSISSMANKKAAIKNQLKYEYEKQAAADSVAHAKESEVKNAELAKQNAEIKAKKNQQYALFGGLGLVMIFAGFMFNRFKVTQKQKEIIEHQKEIVEEQKKLVEEKQKEILDSIHYARRIQMAQIPSEKRVIGMLHKVKKRE
ncbi:MAG: tetratricopeptide repeat protein [Sphingobacteriaceae bacterium]|nr:tetratricopeptide repeat protein [Sphingobacteriaceae bacterium]